MIDLWNISIPRWSSSSKTIHATTINDGIVMTPQIIFNGALRQECTARGAVELVTWRD
jgi:hypothetical protein